MSELPGNNENSFFHALVARERDAWLTYIEHPFVNQLSAGTLNPQAFCHYLIQDYIFLIHFSRAWALAAFKSETPDDIRECAAILHGLIDEEIRMHISYCEGFGIKEAQIFEAEEARENMAYTRFVMERGLAGDLLDLLVALSPCVIGYGVIGQNLIARPIKPLEQNAYRSWIEMYGGEGYGSVMQSALAQLERVAARRLGNEPAQSARFQDLARDFRKACLLEADFWQMGLNAATVKKS